MHDELQEIREYGAARWLQWRAVWLPRFAVLGVVTGVSVVASFASCAWHEELAIHPLIVHDTVRITTPANREPAHNAALMARMCHNRLNFPGLTRADSADILNEIQTNLGSEGGAVPCATWIAWGDK